MNSQKFCLSLVAVFFLLLFFLALPVKAFAATYYVSTSGNDSNSGSQTQPWKTIQKAASTIVAGDTVTVSAGTYTERVQINRSGSAGAQITFHAEGTVVMKGFLLSASYIVMDGFEIANQIDDTTAGVGVYVSGGGHNLVENNYIHDCSWGGIIFGGSTTANTARNNRLYHNGQKGIDISGTNQLVEGNEIWGSLQHFPGVNTPSWADADGIRFFGSGHIVRKNYIHDIPFDPVYNIDPHIDCFQTFGSDTHDIIFEQNVCRNLNRKTELVMGHGFMIEDAYNLTIRNNVIQAYNLMNIIGAPNGGIRIINNTFTSSLEFANVGTYGIALTQAPNTVIKNNIFFEQIGAAVVLNSGSVDAGYNCVYRSDGHAPGGSAYPHDLWQVNPLFVNATNHDFHLQANSPCINAGTALSDVSNDMDGNPRPQGSAYDIGGYEYTGGSGSTPTPTKAPTSVPTATPTPKPVCKADVNADKIVNLADITQILNKWGQSCSGCKEDTVSDGIVNLADLSFVLQYWGQACNN
jgi:parallel beta-helix repeat protein